MSGSVRRRVQFETDMAGVVHFSWYFRYMEEAEHALWREAGLSMASPGARHRLAARGRLLRVPPTAPLRRRVRGLRSGGGDDGKDDHLCVSVVRDGEEIATGR